MPKYISYTAYSVNIYFKKNENLKKIWRSNKNDKRQRECAQKNAYSYRDHNGRKNSKKQLRIKQYHQRMSTLDYR